METLLMINIALTVGLGVWVASLARRVHFLLPSNAETPAPNPHQTTLDAYMGED